MARIGPIRRGMKHLVSDATDVPPPAAAYDAAGRAIGGKSGAAAGAIVTG